MVTAANYIRIGILGLVMALTLAVALPVSNVHASAADEACDAIGGLSSGTGSCVTPGTTTLDSAGSTIVNLLSIVVGIAAVIMIIFGGFKYITSGGDAAAAKTARNVILYAVIGLIVVALAQVIVRFTLDEVTTTPASGGTSQPAGPSGPR